MRFVVFLLAGATVEQRRVRRQRVRKSKAMRMRIDRRIESEMVERVGLAYSAAKYGAPVRKGAIEISSVCMRA